MAGFRLSHLGSLLYTNERDQSYRRTDDLCMDLYRICSGCKSRIDLHLCARRRTYSCRHRVRGGLSGSLDIHYALCHQAFCETDSRLEADSHWGGLVWCPIRHWRDFDARSWCGGSRIAVGDSRGSYCRGWSLGRSAYVDCRQSDPQDRVHPRRDVNRIGQMSDHATSAEDARPAMTVALANPIGAGLAHYTESLDHVLRTCGISTCRVDVMEPSSADYGKMQWLLFYLYRVRRRITQDRPDALVAVWPAVGYWDLPMLAMI